MGMTRIPSGKRGPDETFHPGRLRPMQCPQPTPETREPSRPLPRSGCVTSRASPDEWGEPSPLWGAAVRIRTTAAREPARGPAESAAPAPSQACSFSRVDGPPSSGAGEKGPVMQSAVDQPLAGPKKRAGRAGTALPAHPQPISGLTAQTHPEGRQGQGVRGQRLIWGDWPDEHTPLGAAPRPTHHEALGWPPYQGSG